MRAAKRRQAILAVLADGEYHTTLDICEAAGLPLGSIHPDLAWLECRNLIGSRWFDIDNPIQRPPRRGYFLSTH